jgi:hypothetical protein
MIPTECLLANSQCPLVQRLGVAVAALIEIQRGKIVQRPTDIGVIATERLLANDQ